ncbi:hypothetical protein [Corynebacterium dentalis]|uniref:hypothetical protein n=1 Tax=Corynebacterium dentalis TaxID=2014528 RepID=UPI001178BE1F|nr:hypothetical protein [Corynebacterium dentalis]
MPNPNEKSPAAPTTEQDEHLPSNSNKETTSPMGHLHLFNRGKSTGIHHRHYCGSTAPIDESITFVASRSAAARSIQQNTGLQICHDCVEEQSAQARARKQQQERMQRANDRAIRREELMYDIVDAHKTGADTTNLLDQLTNITDVEGEDE